MVLIIQDKRIQELWRQQINCDSYKYSDHTIANGIYYTQVCGENESHGLNLYFFHFTA